MTAKQTARERPSGLCLAVGVAVAMPMAACSRSHASTATVDAAPSASAPTLVATTSPSRPVAAATRPTPANDRTSTSPITDGALSASALPTDVDEPPVDFFDELGFKYDTPMPVLGSQADLDALKARRIRYHGAVNGRFGFSLDVPDEFHEMPPPTNGDGMEYRLKKLAVLIASAGYWEGDAKDYERLCPSSSHVTMRKATPISCFATGRANGYIFWERGSIAHGVHYSLRFQYVEPLKNAMDPVVAHVYASWRF